MRNNLPPGLLRRLVDRWLYGCAAVMLPFALAGCGQQTPSVQPAATSTIAAVSTVTSVVAASPAPKPSPAASAVTASAVAKPSAAAASPGSHPPAGQAIAVGPPTAPLPDPNTIEVPAAGTCHMSNGLPDHACTPGLLNPDLTTARLCASNFSTKSIRPPVAYTDVLKRRLMASYGVSDSPANYELDHLVSLEDLGHPWSPKNLWPMPRGKSLPGGQPTGVTVNTAEEKDQIETAVHKGICATTNDTARIADLQFRLANNWTDLKQRPTAFGLDVSAAPAKEETEP